MSSIKGNKGVVMDKNRSSHKWMGLAAAGLLAAALFGCSGGGGGGGDTAVVPPAGGGTVTPPAGVAQDGTNAVAATTASAAAWAALAPQATVSSVTISSPPVIKFTVKDAAGKPVLGLGNKSKSATATIAGLTNIAFTLAKLVPGVNGAPSKWVSYNVVRPPTVAEKTATPAASSCNAPTNATWCGTFPAADTQGTLVDLGDGSYQYTFYRDPKQAASLVASLTDSADGLSKKADLGDVNFDPTLTHRLGIQIGGNAPGTGSNTPTGVTVVPAVAMVNTANVVYDFRPDGGAVTSTRNIVKIDSCSECHAGKVLAHGSRKDPQYCMTCHTDQIRYSFSQEASSTNGGLTLTGTTRPTAAVVDGRALGNYPNMIHHIHMGDELVKQGYFFNAAAEGKFNEVKYPQPRTNCVKCHDGSANAVNKTANGDNWKSVPSRLACGGCHDGINFATGRGTTLADAAAGKAATSIGHIGGAKADDTQCALCHDATTIPVYHVTVDPQLSDANSRAWYTPAGSTTAVASAAASQLGTLPADVHKVNFEIAQVTVAGAAGAKQAVVKYRILMDGSPATMNATGFLFNQIDGSPSIYVAYAVPQDGIAAPADWNASVNDTVKHIRDKTAGTASECAAPSSVKGVPSQTGPDASGYYTATLGCVIPDAAAMVTAAIGINYAGLIQLDAAGYTKGILLREPKFAIKTADGYTARRQVVSADKCNNCHGQLGILPSFHGGARNNGEGCVMCHQPNTATGHVGSANNFGGGWSVAGKNLIHGIHGSTKREQAFTYEATAANPTGFQDVTYPGVLKNCEQCHVAGSYDFSGAANAAALPNLLWITDAKGDMSNPTKAASLGLSPWVTTLGKGQINYTADNLVSSPIASSCFGCHDSAKAVTHMTSNGGTLVSLFSSVASAATRPAIGAASTMTFAKKEVCMDCHASTSSYGLGIKAVHAK